ncbi:MAG: TonB-dependent receptor [Psychrobium sp.]
MSLKSISIAICTALSSSALLAQDIERIAVSGEQLKQSANYIVLSRDDFVDSAQNLNDILDQINGIQVRQISGIGNPAAVSIRGSSSKQVQLYIDGQLVNDGQFGGFDLNQLPVENIQSIEVSKEQAIGSGATPIGGVIRINTYNPERETLRLSAGIGSFGYQELNALKNIRAGSFQGAIGLNHVTSDNDYDYLVPQPVANPTEPTVEPLRNNEFEKTTFSANALWIGEVNQLRLNGQFSNQDKALPHYQINVPDNNSSIDLEQLRLALTYLYKPVDSMLSQLEVEGYFDKRDEHYIDNIPQLARRDGFYDSEKTSLSVKPTWQLKQWTLTPFIDINRQAFESKTQVNGETINCNGISACDVKATVEQWLVGGRGDWKSNKQPLSAHVLISQLYEDSRNRVLSSDGAVKQDDSDFVSGELAVQYSWRSIDWGASLSRGVRMPTMFERFGDRGLFKGNGNLKPEQSNAVSLSANYQAARFSVNSAVYLKQVSDAIVATFNSSGIGSYGNVNDADITGFELQADYQVSDAITLQGQANFIDSKSVSEFVAFNNKKLPGIYHREYGIKLSADLTQHLSLDVSSQYSEGLYFNLANKVEQQAQGNGNPSERWLSDVNLRWQQQSFSVSIGVNNLFDETYRDLANRPAQGRNLFIKFSFEE